MKKININRFAAETFSWDTYELTNVKRNGNGELISVTVEAILANYGYNIDTIYEVDANGNTSWATSSWTIEDVSDSKVKLTKTYTSDTSNIKGIEVHNWSHDYTATLYFHFTVIDSDNKTTYITKNSGTAVLKGNVVNNLSTYDWNNAPSVGAVRNYLESSAVLHQSDIENIVSQAVSAALLAGHPIGSIEVNVSGDNPGTYLGGTWESFGAGRVLMGVGTGTDVNNTSQTFSSAEATGGEYTHKLTTQEMPKHKHFNGYKFRDGSGSSWGYRVTSGAKEGNTDGTSDGETGGGQAHNNLQPYITVYFWKRIN